MTKANRTRRRNIRQTIGITRHGSRQGGALTSLRFGRWVAGALRGERTTPTVSADLDRPGHRFRDLRGKCGLGPGFTFRAPALPAQQQTWRARCTEALLYRDLGRLRDVGALDTRKR